MLHQEGRNPKFLYLDVPGLAENRPSVLTGDKIYVRPLGGQSTQNFEGRVEEVLDTKVKLAFSPKLLNM